MPQRVVDSRNPEAAYATKGNIVAPTTAEGGPSTLGGSGVLTRSNIESEYHYAINDASAGASALLTDDTTGQTADTGNLAAGTYDVFVKVRHPSTASANRSLVVAHRNAADNGNTRILETFLADGPTGAIRTGKYTGVQVAVGESFRIHTGSDATNANVYAELHVQRVD
jgi:hypothetical protein